MSPPPDRRALIMTALPIEYQSARTHLTHLSEEVHAQGTIYERGRFVTPDSEWSVLLVETGTNNLRAALEAERAIQHFRPDVALFVGVAGGLKDVSLGDVVAASKVYGYEAGKAQALFEPRPDVGECSHALEQRARAMARSGSWLNRVTEIHPNRTPRALVGPIAAGEKVVADKRSALHQFLRVHYSDALAVEMEGRGFLTATRANRGLDALVIRGISDCIDAKAAADASGSQERASKHASAFAYEVLAQFRLLSPGVLRTSPKNLIPENPSRTDQDVDSDKDFLRSITHGRWVNTLPLGLIDELVRIYEDTEQIKEILSEARILLSEAVPDEKALLSGQVPFVTAWHAWRGAISESAKISPRALAAILLRVRARTMVRLSAVEQALEKIQRFQ